MASRTLRQSKPEVVADLVDRLKEGVPEEMTPVLEAAATVRWFNKDILRAVTSQADVNKAFDELRRFPFVRSRVEGLALHDAVREIMDEYLRVLNPERHRELHERAAAYFETQMAKRTGEEAERLGLERLYHRIRADEEVGIHLFQKMAEELVRYRTLSRFRALLSDVNTYSLRRENSRLWREYYNARLLDLEFRVADAEKVYQAIGENERADPKLRAYALCDWGGTLATDWHLGQTHGAERAIQTLERSLGFGLLDSHLNQSFLWLGRVARYQGDWDKQIEYLEKARNQFDRLGDIYGVISIYVEMKRTYARRGQWNDFFATHKRAVAALSRMPITPSVLKADLWGHWGWAWALAGRFTESEQNAREALKIAHDLQLEFFTISLRRDLGWALGVQGKFKDAYECLDKSLIIIHKRFGRDTAYDEGATLAFLGAILSRDGHPEPAKHNLVRSREIADSLRAIPGTIESLVWLGLARGPT